MPSNTYLRIIAGQFGGRHIQAPAGGKSTRPTLDRVREALFDIIARRLTGARVLDLCAGTGALGLESLSRGAAGAVFVESQRSNIKLIQGNIEALDVAAKCTVVAGELPYALGRVKGKFDVIFFDPPYESDLIEKTVPRISVKGMLDKGGLLVIERDRRSKEIKPKGFLIHRRHRIGDAELWFLHAGGEPEEGNEEEERTPMGGGEE